MSRTFDISTVDPEGLWLIGVSGGVDSMALLHLMVDAGLRNLVVCHLDHGLRGGLRSAMRNL